MAYAFHPLTASAFALFLTYGQHNMTSNLDSLIAALHDDRFKNRFRDRITNTCKLALAFYNGSVTTSHLPNIPADAIDEINNAIKNGQIPLRNNWTQCLYEAEDVGPYTDGSELCADLYTLAYELEKPTVVTPMELMNAFAVYTNRVGGVTDNFSEVFDMFCGHLTYHLLTERMSTAFPICRLTALPNTGDVEKRREFIKGAISAGFSTSVENLNATIDEAELKEAVARGLALDAVEAFINGPSTSDHIITIDVHGIRISPVLAFDQHDGFGGLTVATPSEATLYMRISWTCSPLAMDGVVSEIVPLLESAVRSVAMLSSNLPLNSFDRSPLPRLSLANLRDALPFVRFCVASLWSPSSKGDSLDRRLANAVRLLRESDRQSEDAIGLALSITALEALLGRDEKTNALTEVLGTNLAVLLEPDLRMRNNAIREVKRLYKARSETLHGASLETDSQTRQRARYLVAGALKAVWEHRTFETGKDRANDLFDMLRDRNREPGLPDGVLDSPVRCLWAKEPDAKA